ncbi:MAG TPA: hypothetical protein VK888_11230 [Anaerolineales bacterium]|nr:hypothetical protein [Anaerolineales bacterium]
MEQNQPRIRLSGILLKTALLFVLFNVAFVFIKDVPFGNLTLYNSIIPGRERFPFGETRQSYNLSLFDLDAMFASHKLAGTKKEPHEYRVLLIGDSSVWGTLLTPEQTLAGQLNAGQVNACGKTVRAYNLGYPTISLTKDLLILNQARQYEPDLIVWLTTLEAFPKERQLSSPIVASNPEPVEQLITNYGLSLDPDDPALVRPSAWEQTFVGRRRAVADLVRLQVYGMLWAATGIDQVYPEDYEPAQTDFEAGDDTFHGLTTLENALAFDVLEAGMSVAPKVMLVNEPILVSNGTNNDIRYNFFYPRWAYDQYRSLLQGLADENGWKYLDLWDTVPANEFTNSAIHVTPAGEALVAREIAAAIQQTCN